MHDERCGAVRAGVLRPLQMLAQEAEKFGADLAKPPPVGDRVLPDRLNRVHREDDEDGHAEADDPAFHEQQNQDADDQQQVAEQSNDEVGEEIRQRVNVAVHALDDGAGRMRFVEGQIQAQAMLRHVAAKLVGRDPADVLSDIDSDDVQDLLREGDADKQPRRDPKRTVRFRALGGVDEVTDDLRVNQLHGEPRDEQRGQPDDRSALVLQVIAQKRGVLA